MENNVEIEKKEEKKERGAGLVEYALLAAMVVAIAVVAREQLSTATSQAFSKASSQIGAF